MRMVIRASILDKINTPTKAAPLAAFRILFGLIMLFSVIRFWSNGWIKTLYLDPIMHFHYTGFSFVTVPGNWVYLLFMLAGVSAMMVAIGFKYRWSIVLFFLSFTYIELMDKTTYLNHYYFVSVISFVLIFLPAHILYSVDASQNHSIKTRWIPRWNIDLIKCLIAIVYVYAGLAKLNYDWLFRAMPLTIWLPGKLDFFFLGELMHQKWMHYLFSWAGAIYDLFIVFFLMWKRTRVFAFFAVVVFHLLTSFLFPIGMFPYIMMVSATLFFSGDWHEKQLQKLFVKLGFYSEMDDDNNTHPSKFKLDVRSIILAGFLLFQLLFPLRSYLYSGSVFWHERGYRFSWRVMLMEKTGYANYKIVNGKTGKFFYVQNEDFLTPLQQKEMSTQADFMLEYAQFLENHFSKQGHEFLEIYVDSYASLNGRKSQTFVDNDVNLLELSYRELCLKHLANLDD